MVKENNFTKKSSFLRLNSLFIALSELKKDESLLPQARGARKLAVTKLFPANEEIAKEDFWQAPQDNKKCPVLVTKDFEIAVFNQYANQDRHYHKTATEVYLVIEGEMSIEVEDKNYLLLQGDTIVINPGSIHLVKPSQKQFLCYVFTFNSEGVKDKFVVE